MISFDQDSKNGMEEHDFSVVVGAFPATVDGLVVVFCGPAHAVERPHDEARMRPHCGTATHAHAFLHRSLNPDQS